MLRSQEFAWLRLSIVTLFLISLVPLQTAYAAPDEDKSYESPFGYTVTWTEDWTYDEPLSFEIEGTLDIITLWQSDGNYLMISGFDGTIIDAKSMLTPADDDIVVQEDLQGDVPQLVTETPITRTFSEGYSIDSGTVAVTVGFTAPISGFETSLADTQDQVQINGSSVLIGEPLDDSDSSADLTGTAEPTAGSPSRSSQVTVVSPEVTEEPTSEVTRTTRNANVTPEATDEVTEAPTSEVTRTTRNANVTPEATAEPTEQATDVAAGNLETFVGPVYGYTLQFDPAVWTVEDQKESDVYDGIRFSSPTSSLTIWAWDGYGNDSVSCLQGEVDYYSLQGGDVSDWEPALDANGDPLRFESDELAWGVFSHTYTGSDGKAEPLIAYFSCQPIPEQDAVLMVLLTSIPESYNDDLELTLDILDTLKFANEPQAQTGTVDSTAEAESDNDTDRAEINTNFDGSLYTSPNYGFTVYVPLEWQIVDESTNTGEEKLIVSNGTSDVTLWATDAYTGDVTGCVDFAGSASGNDLTLDQNASGSDFRGVYRNEAFANFVYDADGVKMMYFINCQPIPDSNAFLILIQDVEYSKFTTERRLRNEIENSITMP